LIDLAEMVAEMHLLERIDYIFSMAANAAERAGAGKRGGGCHWVVVTMTRSGRAIGAGKEKIVPRQMTR
jgi:hypothetical protein